MGSPEAVIFDNDGLLLDTEAAWTRAEERLFARRGRVFTLDHKRSLIGSSRSTAAKKLEAMLELAGQGEQLMDELHELVMEEALTGVEPRPGALELLERLLAAGVPVAVASNSQREFVERTLAGADLVDGRFRRSCPPRTSSTPSPHPTSTWRRAGAWAPSRESASRWRTPPRESPRPSRRGCT
jgi:beta-phosphoglucomutase-like phosphatase (HAD superfamily)